jgi:hypothetical protein
LGSVRNADNEAMETVEATLKRINELRNAPNLMLDGNAYKTKYELTQKSIKLYLKDILSKMDLHNPNISEPIRISGRGIRKMTNYGMSNELYKKLFAHIPKMLENAIAFPGYETKKAPSHYKYFKDLIVGIEIDGKPYTVRILLGKEGGYWYYSHFITELEKGSIIDRIRKPNAGNQTASFSDIKDTTLIEILQAPF